MRKVSYAGSRLSVSQISRFMAQSGPIKRSLVARSTNELGIVQNSNKSEARQRLNSAQISPETLRRERKREGEEIRETKWRFRSNLFPSVRSFVRYSSVRVAGSVFAVFFFFVFFVQLLRVRPKTEMNTDVHRAPNVACIASDLPFLKIVV